MPVTRRQEAWQLTRTVSVELYQLQKKRSFYHAVPTESLTEAPQLQRPRRRSSQHGQPRSSNQPPHVLGWRSTTHQKLILPNLDPPTPPPPRTGCKAAGSWSHGSFTYSPEECCWRICLVLATKVLPLVSCKRLDAEWQPESFHPSIRKEPGLSPRTGHSPKGVQCDWFLWDPVVPGSTRTAWWVNRYLVLMKWYSDPILTASF